MTRKNSRVNVLAKSHNLQGILIKIFLVIVVVGSFISLFPIESVNKFLVNLQPIANDRCLRPFYKDTPPYLNKASLRIDSYPLCFDGFSLMYSELSKTALWVAEVLSPHQLRLAYSDQANISQNGSLLGSQLFAQKSGKYYLWQMAPTDQMPNLREHERDTSTENRLPLVSKSKIEFVLNIEQTIRVIAQKYKVDVYTITGPVFLGRTLKMTDDGIIVPTAVFKVIYIPKTGVIGAYYLPNDHSSNPRIVSVCYLEERLGINIFPQLTEEEKRNTYKLPWTETAVNADYPIEYLYWDAESQCAEDVAENQLETLQKKFRFGS